jgi:hypothetical protein
VNAAQVVVRSSRLTNRMLSGLKGVHDGMVLGLCQPSTLEQVDEVYYEEQAVYADPAYNHSGLWWWEREAVETWFAPGGRVVVTAAGGGREVLALRDLGYDAVGYESNEQLRRCAEVPLRPVARDRFPTDAGAADAVIVGWGSYMHIRGATARIEFLRAARRCLPPGGAVLLSFFARTGDGAYYRTVHAIGSRLRRLRPGASVELGDGIGPSYVHWFTEAELRAEVTAAGLELRSWATGDYGRAVAVVPAEG